LTDVEYSADGSSVTLYLDGGVPQTASSRALTKDLARAGHDYFEVIFYHVIVPASGPVTTHISRASWEIGEAAGVKNVYRTVTGVDYALTGVSGAIQPVPPATGTTEAAYAVLFVGRKSDKTLLAVGKIAGVYAGTTSEGTFVTTASTKVTFQVNALTAGLRLLDNPMDTAHPSDTFLTNAKNPGGDVSSANTDLQDAWVKVGDTPYHFPAYQLPLDKSLNATYTINTVTGAAAYKTAFELPSDPDPDLNAAAAAAAAKTANDPFFHGVRIDDYSTILASFTFIKIPPRFPIGGGLYKGISDPYADDTVVSHGLSITNDTAFTGAIPFEITTPNYSTPGTTKVGGVCALTFQYPVYAISKAQYPGVDEAITWFIRPGFGPAMYNLDDGSNSTGGAILLAVGDANIAFLEVDTTWVP
jgi:hypothetical protein